MANGHAIDRQYLAGGEVSGEGAMTTTISMSSRMCTHTRCGRTSAGARRRRAAVVQTAECRRRLPVPIPATTMAEEMGTGAVATVTHRDSVLQVRWGRGGRDGKFTGGARARGRRQWRTATPHRRSNGRPPEEGAGLPRGFVLPALPSPTGGRGGQAGRGVPSPDRPRGDAVRAGELSHA